LCGQGNFLPGVNYPVNDVAAGFAVGDINGDKKLDVIVANLDGKGDEPENSIFNPKNSEYILKKGC